MVNKKIEGSTWGEDKSVNKEIEGCNVRGRQDEEQLGRPEVVVYHVGPPTGPSDAI